MVQCHLHYVTEHDMTIVTEHDNSFSHQPYSEMTMKEMELFEGLLCHNQLAELREKKVVKLKIGKVGFLL